MSSLGINQALVRNHNPPTNSAFNKVPFNQIPPFNHSVSIAKKAPKRISASNPLISSTPRNKAHKDPIFAENLDEWMRDSVTEIVRSIKQAPLLVQIYADNDGCSTDIKTDKANAEDWDDLYKGWISGDKPSPDGVILVEELSDAKDAELEEQDDDDDETRAFGVVIQGKGKGKGMEYGGPACYLLKTSRVGVGSGMGLFSTHFCLVRVNNFNKTALSQIRDCWLIR